MRKIIYTLLSILIIANSTASIATELQGGVSFNVDSARQYVQEGQANYAEVFGPFEFVAQNTERVVYSYNNGGDVIGITVQYINEPTKAYIYGRDKKLIFMDKYDKPTNVYPHRGYRYKPDGELFLTTLTVSKNETFRFTPEGELLAHTLNGVTYDEAGNIIGRCK